MSDTAEWGDYQSGKRVIDEHARDQMRQVLTEIQDGTFATEWVAESKGGLERYKALMAEDLDRPIEKVGRELRGRMSWLHG